jgi:hypothetical protein
MDATMPPRPDCPEVLLHINGQWRPGSAGATLPVDNPASGATIGRVAVAEREDLDEALAAAARLLRERAAGIASGDGSKGGAEALEGYLNTKSVSTQIV